MKKLRLLTILTFSLVSSKVVEHAISGKPVICKGNKYHFIIIENPEVLRIKNLGTFIREEETQALFPAKNCFPVEKEER